MAVDWAKLKLFDCVAEAGSFTEGARRLHMSQPALSRQIASLEESLGAKLFHRHARGLVLTHEGEQLHESTREVSDRIDRTMMGIEASRARPTGEVRLATTVSFGSTWLARQMGDFVELYPDVTVQLILADEETDLARREADCAIRFHAPHQSDLIRKALAPVHYRVCGSPEYLERYGEPQTLDDLAGHRIVSYGPSAPTLIRGVNWLSQAGEGSTLHAPVLTINNIFGILQAVETGVGLAVLPSYLIQFSRRVRVVLPAAPAPMFRTFFCYPSELRRSLRIGVLRDFIAERMTAEALNPALGPMPGAHS